MIPSASNPSALTYTVAFHIVAVPEPGLVTVGYPFSWLTLSTSSLYL